MLFFSSFEESKKGTERRGKERRERKGEEKREKKRKQKWGHSMMSHPKLEKKIREE